MRRFVAKLVVPMLIGIVFGGCTTHPSGPASVRENSDARPELADRVRFIEGYVTFRRKYDKLEYDVLYQNNGGGMVPGPSDWDIRLLAVVPSTEVDAWIPKGVAKAEAAPPQWLRELPGVIAKDGITEWYRKSGLEVGVDRSRAIVAYRNTSTPN